MNGKKIILIALSVMLILLALVSSLVLDDVIANKILSVATTCTAVIGAIALIYQMKREKELNEARFLVEYSGTLYSTYDCSDFMDELEKSRVNPDYHFDVEENYQKIVGYLEWLETLASLVNSNLLQISKIDNVLSYRYFIIVNNKQVQDRELIPNRDFYRGIYELYPKWEKYKKSKGLPIIFEENALSKLPEFQKIVR